MMRARRIAFVLDNAAYFAAGRAAMRKAQRSITILGWTFNPFIDLVPELADDDAPRRIGPLLAALAEANEALDIRVLIWKPSAPIEAGLLGNARTARRFFAGTRVRFHLDATAPFGASHHTKLIVVDDAVAFCGGADLSDTRWDTDGHLDNDVRRRDPSGRSYPPRHSITCVVDGAAARALGDHARERWQIATGETPPVSTAAEADLWSPMSPPDMLNTDVLIQQTRAGGQSWPEARDNLDLSLAEIAVARRFIYMENELIAAPALRDAFAARLGEANGPEIVLITGARAPTLLSRLATDPARDLLIRTLAAADKYGRLRILAPYTAGGRAIIVHSKLMIVDDRIIRIGSANLNNRSIAFDSELDLAIHARDDAARAAITRFRARTIAHLTGGPPEAIAAGGSVIAAIEAANQTQRLRAINIGAGPVARVIARYHLGDPVGVEDALRPWKRQR